MSDHIISARRIYKTFGTTRAVDDLSFDVSAGTCLGLLGPNGAGKTTMMNMVYGRCTRDTHPQSTLSVFGFDPREDELSIKYLSGIVPQEDNLDVELNVEQNLLVYSKFYGMPLRTAQSRIGELLEFLDLGKKQKSRIRSLSGGMKRRLVIARALLNDPRLLILDEPTTGLDPQVRHAIWDKVRILKREGKTILLTTHYMEEAFQICDTVLIMNKGSAVVSGDPQQLVENSLEKCGLEIPDRGQFRHCETAVAETAVRVDSSREGVLLYSNDAGLLKRIAADLPPGGVFIRQSNLEDIFLKTTGRVLGDGQ